MFSDVPDGHHIFPTFLSSFSQWFCCRCRCRCLCAIHYRIRSSHSNIYRMQSTLWTFRTRWKMHFFYVCLFLFVCFPFYAHSCAPFLCSWVCVCVELMCMCCSDLYTSYEFLSLFLLYLYFRLNFVSIRFLLLLYTPLIYYWCECATKQNYTIERLGTRNTCKHKTTSAFD